MRAISRKTPLLIASIVLFAVSAGAINAAVLITIDPTNIASVRFDATAEPAEKNDATSDFIDGVTLIGVLTSNFFVELDFDGTLGASGGRFEDGLTGVGTANLRDLNLYNAETSTVQIFSTSAPAFRGSALIDLPGTSIAVGSYGDIIVGDTISGSGEVIGQWRAIPEPSATLLVGLGCLVLRIRRRKP